jgi:hypothetical protein
MILFRRSGNLIFTHPRSHLLCAGNPHHPLLPQKSRCSRSHRCSREPTLSICAALACRRERRKFLYKPSDSRRSPIVCQGPRCIAGDVVKAFAETRSISSKSVVEPHGLSTSTIPKGAIREERHTES